MLIHNVSIRVFVKENDEESRVKAALFELLPDVDFEKEKLNVEATKAAGFNEEKIIILELNLKKQKHIKLFVDKLVKGLNAEQKDMLLRQRESRLDEDLNFYIRLEKHKLMQGFYWVTDSGNCFHIKMLIASFPKKKETAMKVVEEIFG